jgi:cobalamin biosynthesis protein CobW
MTASADRVPCTVVTGFLGAGKTTLIRNLIENVNGRRIAIIVNEFGDVGIDGEILKSCGIENCPEENVLELANGCICCTVADDFVPALDQILAREPKVDHILIETSGLALPKPLVQAFQWPAIKGRVTVDGVVAVVDGPALADGRVAADMDALAAQRAADETLDHDDPVGRRLGGLGVRNPDRMVLRGALAGPAMGEKTRRVIGPKTGVQRRRPFGVRTEDERPARFERLQPAAKRQIERPAVGVQEIDPGVRGLGVFPLGRRHRS